MPHVFADQIEYFCNNITEREKVCVSVHVSQSRCSFLFVANAE